MDHEIVKYVIGNLLCSTVTSCLIIRSLEERSPIELELKRCALQTWTCVHSGTILRRIRDKFLYLLVYEFSAQV